jgi:hypothetical protein
MRRRLIYLATAACVAGLVLIAVALPGVRVGFISLAAAIVLGSRWVTRRLPAVPPSVGELRGAAALALVSGIAVAVMLPSTRVPCDCPPSHVAGVIGCNCAVDHHTLVRVVIALVGIALSISLAAAARRRTSSDLSTRTPGPLSR